MLYQPAISLIEQKDENLSKMQLAKAANGIETL
jgi:hypothetical protein